MRWTEEQLQQFQAKKKGLPLEQNQKRSKYNNKKTTVDGIEFEECLYKENLDKGLNFYTEYNENNKRKKEEYEERTLDTQSSKVVPLNTELKKISTKTYIKVHDRIFAIGERGYGGWTRDLKEEDKDNLTSLLQTKNIGLLGGIVKDMAKNDEPSEGRRCNCKVILTIDRKEYNLQNYNSRAIRQDTAEGIKNYLESKGFNAEIEALEGFSGRRIIKNTKAIKLVKDSPKKEVKPILEQISMFGT